VLQVISEGKNRHTNVSPHSFERDTSSCISCDDIRNINEVCRMKVSLISQFKRKAAHILTLIPKPTLMEPKRPIRNFSRQTRHLRILPCHLTRVLFTPSKEVKVQYPSNDIIFQRRAARPTIRDLDVHPIRVEQKHAVGTCCPMLKVYRVVPVQIRSGWYTVRIAGPQGKCRIVCREAEWVSVLA
jgi:hypothetical protein